ncbi:MAG: DNA primase [Verrucomicrobia bacterium]|nr:DNA primase [Verrucomicrobiota bacterium]
MIAPTTLEQIRAANDIVEVIGASIPLKRAGANFIALCPFHREKTPSFSVNPHKQIFYCFGCHKGGDVFAYIRAYENLTFVEAVKRLADRARIPLAFDNQPGQKQAQHLKDTLWQMHDQIARRWQTALANDAAGQIARDYLAKRGVSQEAVELFQLGYAPEAWDDTVNWGRSKGYELALLEQGGLIIHKEDSDRYYDRFRGRLMFPICDEQGRVIAFSGRVLSGDEKTAKYVNSPETPIFTKGKVFYGLDKSKRAILDAGFGIICEGQLDLIACYMAGVQNIVAPQGTAFTPDHARILKRYVNEVVLCFDSDNAGQNATVRVLDSLLASDLAIRVAVVPAPHDPDSFIKANGGEAFRELINQADGFFDFYLKRLCATNDAQTDLGRTSIVNLMREAVWKTGNTVLMEAWARKTAQRLGVPSDAVRAEFRKNKASRYAGAESQVEEAPAPEVEAPPSPHEIQLLKLLLATDEAAEFIASHLQTDWLGHATVRRLVEERLRLHAAGEWMGPAAFLGQFEEDQAAQALLGQCLAEEQPIPKPDTQMLDVLLYLRNQAITRQMGALLQRLNRSDLSKAESDDLLRQRISLRKLKDQPLASQAAF